MKNRSNKNIFVDNFSREVGELLFYQAFTQWCTELGNRSILSAGIELFLDDKKQGSQSEENQVQVVDIQHVKDWLGKVLKTGCLMVRKTAAIDCFRGVRYGGIVLGLKMVCISLWKTL